MNIYGIRKFCSEDISLIENYEEALNDKSQRWDCHHRLETTLNKTPKELEELGLYWNRPASELIFLPHKEHAKLHCYNFTYSGKDKPLSKEHKEKLSISLLGKNKGKSSWIKGKNLPEETKRKMSESRKKYYQRKRLLEQQ